MSAAHEVASESAKIRRKRQKRGRASAGAKENKTCTMAEDDKENVVNFSSSPACAQLIDSTLNSPLACPDPALKLSQDPFLRLLEDTADEVLRWLSPEELLRVALVSTYWQKLSLHKSLWAVLRRSMPPGYKGPWWRLFFTFIDGAGKGDEATCYRVRDRATGEVVLAKCVPVNKENGVSRWLLREAALLWNIDQPCVARLQGAIVDKDVACLFFDDAGSTNLHRLACTGDGVGSALNAAKPVLDLAAIRRMMHAILSSVAACHTNQIIHRNVKPSKFLIGEDGECRMTSFTSSLMGGGTVVQRPLMPRMGTTQYLAPEVLLGAADLELDYTTYTEKVDMWAAGLILAEMAAGGPLFVVDSEIDLLFSIFRMLGTPNEETWPGVRDLACSIEDFPSWPAKVNLEDTFSVLGSTGCHLLSRMLCFDARARISAIEALSHPFFIDHGYDVFVYDVHSVPSILQLALPKERCAEWATLLKKESDIPATSDYLAVATPQGAEAKLNERMRAILVDWLAEVSYSWCMRAERRALHSAVQCLDRFLSRSTVTKKRLQLIGATCYALAAKLEEAEVIAPNGYAHISDFAFTEDEMRICEVEIADALGCRFAYATAPDFEPLLTAAMGMLPHGTTPGDTELPRVISLAQMLSDYMLLGYHVAQNAWKPSVVASAAFVISSVALNADISNAVLCSTSESELCACVQAVLQAYSQGLEWDLRNLSHNPKYALVAGIDMPAISYVYDKVREGYQRL